MGKTYFVSPKEMPRAGLIRAALAGKITNSEGAGSLDLSVRQFQRLKIRYRESGARGLLHQSRGRPSGAGLSENDRRRIQVLMQSTYNDFNDCHLTEKLREVEKISVSRETVRRIRLELKKGAKRKRRAPKHRSRRLREARVGALVQIDGSPHDWLEGRGPEMSLVGGVDDATGTVLGGVFRLQEDLHGYAALFYGSSRFSVDRGL
jgi:transposase